MNIENKHLPDGLSKLEYFTAMAMNGILSNSEGWTDSDQSIEWVANAAIKFAVKTLLKLNFEMKITPEYLLQKD